ncbi:MAG: hypothetical protein HY231_07775 [Acidobacteria bacterium]|nr:hypothetical protein [Acidobacteriota bacterium]
MIDSEAASEVLRTAWPQQFEIEVSGAKFKDVRRPVVGIPATKFPSFTDFTGRRETGSGSHFRVTACFSRKPAADLIKRVFGETRSKLDDWHGIAPLAVKPHSTMLTATTTCCMKKTSL